MSTDSHSLEEVVYTKGQKVWWRASGRRIKAEFSGMSKSGKRARIRFERESAFLKGKTYMSGTFVNPKNLEPRDE